MSEITIQNLPFSFTSNLLLDFVKDKKDIVDLIEDIQDCLYVENIEKDIKRKYKNEKDLDKLLEKYK